MTITLPHEYGYVLLAATSTLFVNTLHSMFTSVARKKAGVKYPAAYASNEAAEKDPNVYVFNCAQKSHANFTENLTPFLGALLVSGLRYPVLAAALGAGWAACRAVYAWGYVKSGPGGRILGSALAGLIDISLKFMAIYTSVKFVLELQ